MKNTGFIRPQIAKEHWVLGGSGMPFIEYRKDGDWTYDLPLKEPQRIVFDTYNCTSFGTLSQIEAYMYQVHGMKVNYSDRWLGIVACTRPPGNDPHVVYEAIRKHGLIPEEMLPFSEDLSTVEEYYSFKGADEAACREAGQKWLQEWDFQHEWVNTEVGDIEERMHNLKVALKSSPVALAVYAWREDNRNIYVKFGPENHWTLLAKFDDLQRVFDSYDPYEKDVEQDIWFAKRIYITKREQNVYNPSWLRELFDIIKSWFTSLLK